VVFRAASLDNRGLGLGIEAPWVLFGPNLGPKDRAVCIVFDQLKHDDRPSRYVVIRDTARNLSTAIETLHH